MGGNKSKMSASTDTSEAVQTKVDADDGTVQFKGIKKLDEPKVSLS